VATGGKKVAKSRVVKNRKKRFDAVKISSGRNSPEIAQKSLQKYLEASMK